MHAPGADFISRHALRNFASGFLAAYGSISFFCFMFLEPKWTALAPKVPKIALGSMYQHAVHGDYAYFTGFQATAYSLLFMTSIPVFFVAVAIAPKKNLKATSGKLNIRLTYDFDDPLAIRWKAGLLGALVTPPFVFILGPHIVTMLNSMGVFINLG